MSREVCRSEQNRKHCSCSFGCSRAGVCCDCLDYHRSRGELPACYFPDDVEPRGDRSIENFIAVVSRVGTGYLR